MFEQTEDLQGPIALVTGGGKKRRQNHRAPAGRTGSTRPHQLRLFLRAGQADSNRNSRREVFDTTGLHVRHYDDGGVRVTVGVRASTRAILAAVQARLELGCGCRAAVYRGCAYR
jgi:histidinol-phosphate aminotransferase